MSSTDLTALSRELLRGHQDHRDVAQETWILYQRQPAEGLRSPRAWLKAAMVHLAARMGQRERSRKKRERIVARPERVPSVEEEVARSNLHDLVRSLVWELPEPYREVVQLRYMEDREVEEIAALLGRSAGTVRSQLKRGLDRLRERMGIRREKQREHRGVRGFFVLLFRLRQLRPSARWMACVALGCLGAIALFPLWNPRDADVAAARRAAPDSGRNAPLLSTPAPVRSAERVSTDPATEEPRAPTLRSKPDAPDSARIEWPISIHGRVLGPGSHPLAGASLRVGEEQDAVGRVVGISDEAGTFQLEELDGRLWIWAETDVHRPSERHLLATTQTERELILRTGEAVNARSGRILSADRIPVAGAMVTAVGSSLTTFSVIGDQGTIVRNFDEYRHTGVTAQDGTFAFSLGTNGVCELLVQAEGSPSALFTLTAMSSLSRDLILPRGGTIRGRVFSQAGSSLAGARVRLELPRPHASLETLANERGEFTFTAVPAVRHELVASPAVGQERVSRLAGELKEGAVLTRDIHLVASSTLCGIVLGEEAPLVDWIVELERTRTDLFPDRRRANTGADGRFAFSACMPGEEYLVSVRAADEEHPHWIGKQRVGDGSELSIRVSDVDWTPSVLRGTIAADQPEDLPLFVELWSDFLMRGWMAPVDPRTGAYSIDPVPPGSYVLLAWTRRLGAITVNALTLPPGRVESRDTTLLAPGTLRVRVRGPADFAPHRVEVACWGRDIGAKPFSLRWLSRGEEPLVFTAELFPGEHEYRVWVDGQTFDMGRAGVSSRQTTEVMCTIPTLVTATLLLEFPRPLLEWDDLKVTVRAEREWTCLRGRSLSQPEDRHVLRLPIDTREIEVRSDSGLFGVWQGPLEIGSEPLEIWLPLDDHGPAR